MELEFRIAFGRGRKQRVEWLKTEVLCGPHAFPIHLSGPEISCCVSALLIAINASSSPSELIVKSERK